MTDSLGRPLETPAPARRREGASTSGRFRTEIVGPIGEPFGCIYADPPWNFVSFDGVDRLPSTGKGNFHYGTTKTEDLATIPVSSMAAKDCALFIWVISSHMEQAMALGKAWGFALKTTAFVWVKARDGFDPLPTMGYWTRKQTEQCWLFTRGSPKRLSKGVSEIIHCARGAHSAKPDRTYERIEALVGGPYLELFARTQRPGWSAWGNQVGIRDGGLNFSAPPAPPVQEALL